MNIVKVCTIPSGDKYSHAKKWKIPCVTSAWVFDSIERGHCLPPDLYRVDRQAKTGNEQDQRLAEVSILNPDVSVKKRVDDTINTTAVLAEIKRKTTADWLAELELTRVKKAGTFLDGCRIFLSGFSHDEQVLLGRVLKYAGAVRLSQLVESITHCVHSLNTNTVSPDTVRLMGRIPDLSPHMVSVQWLVESMRLGSTAPESEFIFPPETGLEQGDVPRHEQPPLPPPVSTEVRTEELGEDMTHFEETLKAQYGKSSKTGNKPSHL